jgi:hypothetical protein
LGVRLELSREDRDALVEAGVLGAWDENDTKKIAEALWKTLKERLL